MTRDEAILEGRCPTCDAALERRERDGWCPNCKVGWAASWHNGEGEVRMTLEADVSGLTTALRSIQARSSTLTFMRPFRTAPTPEEGDQ